MIIVLKGADFSANNIGTVEVPRELNPFTLAAIALSGNESMTDEQKNALDVFFEDIGAFGTKSNIWSKLDKVYLPMICAALNKSCINYVSGNIDVDPSSLSWIELRNHGLGRVADSTIPSGEKFVLDSNYVWNWSNKSAFIFNTEQIAAGVGGQGINNYKGTSWPVHESIVIQNNNGSGDIQLLANSITQVCESEYEWASIDACLHGGSVSVSENKVVLFSQKATGNVRTKVKSFTAGITDNFNDTPKELFFGGSNIGGYSLGAAALGAMILGSYLTPDECSTLGDAFDELWEAFNV